MYTGTSNYQIIDFFQGSVSVILYDEIQRFDTVSDLMGQSGKIVILYETSENYGHWVCLFRNSDGINFFDSYGTFPDDQREYIPWSLREDPFLLRLLLDSSDKIFYNQYRFQDCEVQTCGRWCAVRLLLSDFSVDDFADLILTSAESQHLSLDRLVTKITSDL